MDDYRLWHVVKKIVVVDELFTLRTCSRSYDKIYGARWCGIPTQACLDGGVNDNLIYRMHFRESYIVFYLTFVLISVL